MDAFAAFLSELEKADDAARAALTEYLKRDSRYIDTFTPKIPKQAVMRQNLSALCS
ncbi:hypothetical protein [Neisseria gonorrhoeae]|uniref:hypothetical protein n=1 Tax=Neisseria gonorrhoeae TaxID=485 RepID=UPI00352AB065